jgi:hypothetical protein
MGWNKRKRYHPFVDVWNTFHERFHITTRRQWKAHTTNAMSCSQKQSLFWINVATISARSSWNVDKTEQVCSRKKWTLTKATCLISPDQSDDATTKAPSTRESYEREKSNTDTTCVMLRVLSVVIQIYQKYSARRRSKARILCPHDINRDGPLPVCETMSDPNEYYELLMEQGLFSEAIR